MFYLAKYVVGAALPAFLAGMVYSFSAYHFAHATAHLNLSQMGWTPLSLLFLIKTLNERQHGLRNGPQGAVVHVLEIISEQKPLTQPIPVGLVRLAIRPQCLQGRSTKPDPLKSVGHCGQG